MNHADANLPRATEDRSPQVETGNSRPTGEARPFRSTARLRASRENGKKSQGPKTAEGKSNSRKNALKHGLSSQDPAVLPPDLTQEVRAEVELFTRDLKPQSHIEQRLVETAALSCVRFLRLSHAEVCIAQSRARAAIPNWQAERKASVRQLADALDAARPGAAFEAVHALKRTSHGCRLLASRYQKLIDELTKNEAFTLKHLEVLARLEAFNGTMPDASDTQPRKNLWRHLLALLNQTDADLVGHIARHAFVQDHETFVGTLPDPNTSRRKLIQYLSKRKHALTQRARHLWETQDRPARDEAPSRALFDPTPEGKLLARYMNDAQRTMRLALKELQKAQKTRDKLGTDALTTDHQRPTKSEAPFEPSIPQTQPESMVTPVGRVDDVEAHQRICASGAQTPPMNTRPPTSNGIPVPHSRT